MTHRVGGLRPVSAQRAKDNRTRAVLTKRILAERPDCEVCDRLTDALHADGHRAEAARIFQACGNRRAEPPHADALHELRKRSSAGSILNKDNCIPACTSGNHAVEKWPIQARAAGLVIREGDPEWDALSVRNDR